MDNYLRASNGSGEATRAIITTPREIGDSNLIVDSVLNYPAIFIGTTGELDTETGIIDQDSVSVFYGYLSGSIVIIDHFAPGYNDVGNTVNQVLLIKPTTPWATHSQTVACVWLKPKFYCSKPCSWHPMTRS